MNTDRPTLEHLDILGSDNQTRSVFALLDQTLTNLGRRRLHARVVGPPSTSALVLDLQDAHRELAASLAPYRAAIAESRLDSVERYLESRWLLPSSMPRARRLTSWYRSYRQDALDGLDACRSMLGAARTLAAQCEQAASVLLRRHAETLRRLVSSAAAQTLVDLAGPTRASARRLHASDDLARGAASDTLWGIAHAIGELDALQSVAGATIVPGWALPVFGADLRVRGLRHPLLGDESVRNDVVAECGVHVIFVTGPNMAGKSTFIKAIAIAVLLAHVGAAVPAVAMETPFFDALFSSAHVRDDVQRGESMFLAEAKRMTSLARTIAEHGRTFVVLDEPFRGTNVHDATEATQAVLQRLVARARDVVFVASHLTELAPMLSGLPAVALLQFEADCSSGAPVFDYRVKSGVSSQRLGMHLLRREGVLELLDSALEPSAAN